MFFSISKDGIVFSNTASLCDEADKMGIFLQ